MTDFSAQFEVRPALIVLCGLPGLGKSTLARALARRHGAHIESADEVWATTSRRGVLEDRQRAVYARMRNAARERLRAGTTVIVDSAALSADYRAPWVELARLARVPAYCVALVPDAALSRQRRSHLGPALERMVAAWQEPTTLEGFEVVKFVTPFSR